MAELPSKPLDAGNNTIIWLAVTAALSPVLVDTVTHALRDPAARPALFFALAFAARAWTSPRETPRSSWFGFGLALVAALAAAALAAADWPRFGRLAIPLCALGLSARGGRPTLAVAGIALWCVPLPSLIVDAASPGLETTWLRLAGLVTPKATSLGFSLIPADGGLALAWSLAGAGYLRALSLGRTGVHALPLCLAGALAALPIQLFAIVAIWFASASLGTASLAPEKASWILRDVFPLVVVGLAVLAAPWRPHAHLHR
ncbi:MAG: hypothetical protein VX246_09195 [Myxococcota bacterium]|nr:hypothetical protein [Myxococcota bacterium]